MARSRIIKGVSVTPGLALGPVHVVRSTPDLVPTWSLSEAEVPREIERLHRGIEAAKEELELRRRRVAREAGEQEAGIFSVHRMILEDPLALGSIERRIREERINAEACIQLFIESLGKNLKAVEGDSVRSYGADIADPWRIVLARLLAMEDDELHSLEEPVILAAAELTPHVVTLLDRARVLGIVCERGGRFSHGAVLARSFGIPCVVDLPGLLPRLEQGMRLIVDGDRGTVQLRPDQEDIDAFLAERERRRQRLELLSAHARLPARTPDGHELTVLANIESVRDLDTFDLAYCDGVGLLRTEFMYLERPEFPSEDEQYRLYRRVLERLDGRPLTMRTLDIGADKQLPYFQTPNEPNPALGWRGLRVTLEWQDLLRVQLRAAMRASAHGEVRILLPMVTSLEEVRQVREIQRMVSDQLVDQGFEIADHVPLGIMVEVPSSLIVLDQLLEEADFVSVGTNDLVQYLLATDRDNPWVSNLYDPHHPAVVRALESIAATARRLGKPSSVCGEIAGDHGFVLALLAMGFDAVSVAPNFLGEVKYALRETPFAEARQWLERIREERTAEGVRRILGEVRERLHERLQRSSTGSEVGAADGAPEEGTTGRD